MCIKYPLALASQLEGIRCPRTVKSDLLASKLILYDDIITYVVL